MAYWLLVLLVALATYRVARVLTQEELFRPWRERVARRFGPESKLTYLVECPACVSIWVGAILATLAVLWPTNRGVWGVIIALSASALTVLLINKGEPNE